MKIVYEKDESDAGGEDCAWVDSVTWTPTSVPDVVPSVPGDPDAVVTGDAMSGFTVSPSAASGAVEVTIPSGVEIDLKASDPSITTAPTRLGLTYTFREGTTLEGMTLKDQKQGDGEPWTPTISVKGGTSGFYSIDVGK